MRLSKHHGLGNDFLVALAARNPGVALPGPAEARRLCERRRGIGADGVLLGLPSTDAAADLRMVLYNADGSRAEISGNGIRCLAQAVARHRGLSQGTLRVATDAGLRALELRPGPDGATALVSVEMGRLGDGPHVPAPVAESLRERHATVDAGNPHLVVLVDDPAGVDLATEGAWLERQFQGGANVEFITVPAPDTVRLRVWERGSGITEACGSGACAAAHVAHRWGLVGERVAVQMPGGEAEVLLADGQATLVGPAVHIAEIEVDPVDADADAGDVPAGVGS